MAVDVEELKRVANGAGWHGMPTMWDAIREIEHLRAEIASLTAENEAMRDMLPPAPPGQLRKRLEELSAKREGI